MRRPRGNHLRRVLLVAVVLIVAADATSAIAEPGRGLGPRAGYGQGPDEVFLGILFETPPVLGPARFAPSVDIGLGDTNAATANVDLRWYLLPLPETGLSFYGSAGPTWTFSPSSEIGLSLAIGANIPTKSERRYNVEVRFGFGDAPDLKIAVGYVFGI